MLHNYKILIIDDDKSIQDMLINILEQFHADSFEIAETYNEARNMLLVGDFDFIILDLNLSSGKSDRSGIKVIEDLGNAKSRIPVLIYSAFVPEHKSEIMIKSKRNFVMAFLEKAPTTTMIYDLITAIGDLKDKYECKKLKYEDLPQMKLDLSQMRLELAELEEQNWGSLSRVAFKTITDNKVLEAVKVAVVAFIAYLVAKLT